MAKSTQALIEVMVEGVVVQGKKCMADGGCAYRGDEPGVACAVGHAIPQTLYDHGKMEWSSLDVANLYSGDPNWNGINKPLTVIHAVEVFVGRRLRDYEIELMRLIQKAHDSTDGLNDWAFIREFINKVDAILQDFNRNGRHAHKAEHISKGFLDRCRAIMTKRKYTEVEAEKSLYAGQNLAPFIARGTLKDLPVTPATPLFVAPMDDEENFS